MNSHFKKIRKGNTGKIGVWDVKNKNRKNKICEGIYKKSKRPRDS